MKLQGPTAAIYATQAMEVFHWFRQQIQSYVFLGENQIWFKDLQLWKIYCNAS